MSHSICQNKKINKVEKCWVKKVENVKLESNTSFGSDPPPKT